MKKTFLTLLFALTTTLLMAQRPDGPPDPEKIEALRIAFLTNYLDLTTEESQKFWPVYNQMKDELKVYLDKEADLMKGKKVEEMTEAELNGAIQTHFDNEQQILNLKKKYTEEFKKVLPLKKVVLLADAENAFKRQLLEYARDRKGPGGGGPGNKAPGDNRFRDR
ncbi:MAG: hypothetical protein ACKVPJ_11865 [Chitinophagales bacterium]